MNVVQMREADLRNVPAQLRMLADRIEAGTYGQVGTCGVCILGSTFEAFGFGDGIVPDGIGPSVALLFQAGVQRIAGAIETCGK